MRLFALAALVAWCASGCGGALNVNATCDAGEPGCEAGCEIDADCMPGASCLCTLEALTGCARRACVEL